MFEKSKATNMPLPDQLDEVRDKIKVLKAREAELVEQLKLRGGEKGAFVEAIIAETVRRSLDTALIKAEYGEALEPFYRETPVVTVRLGRY
jgi:acyl-CoA reductase-like NAD-dependent aldehyde dehydrogenase